MKLVSLQIFPSGSKGWGSDRLRFGDNVTQLFGPNGCGKTPVVQSIAYCLGFPCVFRNDIYDRCNYVTLHVETKKGELVISRTYSRDVDIEVTDPSGQVQRFYNEKDYSLYIFDWLDLNVSNLVTNANKSTPPYLASMLPIFYLDQDDGYSRLYCPPGSFIKDQFSEMVRMLFDLPVKNSFDDKKEKINAKEKLDFLDRQVESQSRRVEVARQSLSVVSSSSAQIKDEISRLEIELDHLKSTEANRDDSVNTIDRLISNHRKKIIDIGFEISETRKRTTGIGQIVHEINTEIETLNLNEESRRVFLSFGEICGSAQCQLFSSSSDSYSKNLLYLKDQIKDLERNSERDELKIEQLEIQKKQLEDLVQGIVDERNRSVQKSEVSSLVDAISEIKNQVFELQNQLSDIEKVESLESIHLDLINRRGRALEEYQAFSSDRSIIPSIIRIKAELRKTFLKWLDVIHTSNVSHDITFRDDFFPILGGESVSQLKGSTRIRAVLAYHAALIELMAKFERLSFRFLILDTPKQHEIHVDDLDRYLKALKDICVSYGVQVVFSTTEYHYEGDSDDAEWLPVYPGEEQKMFLYSAI